MTTIHAVPRGTVADTGKYLSLVFQSGHGEPLALLAPKDEFRRALIDTGGVGRFDLQIGADPTLHHAIAQKVERGAAPESYRKVVVQEVPDEAVVRMQVLVRPSALPAAVNEHRAQAIQRQRHLVLRGRMDLLPESLRVDLSQLEVGGRILAGDVQLPDEVELVGSPLEVLFELRQLVPPIDPTE